MGVASFKKKSVINSILFYGKRLHRQDLAGRVRWQHRGKSIITVTVTYIKESAEKKQIPGENPYFLLLDK
jgi:hypothetical protein